METVTFHCETITPMFCYGADQTTPEIRAASIKGGLRFWWRALNGHLSINELRKREAEIFGGSGTGEDGNDARRSKVIVRVMEVPNYKDLVESFKIPEDSLYKIEYNKIKYSPVPHKPEGKNFPQPCIPCGTNFNIELKLVKSIKFEKEENFNLESLKSLFIIYSILGGIGKRSRRGFGSFKINQIDDETFSENIDSEYISGQIENINSSFKWNQTHRNNNYPYLKNIKIGKSGSYKDLLKEIGEASHENSYSDYTGFAKGNNRLSSPLYVSTYTQNNVLAIIFSELNCSFKNGWNPRGEISSIKNFRQNLRGGQK